MFLIFARYLHVVLIKVGTGRQWDLHFAVLISDDLQLSLDKSSLAKHDVKMLESYSYYYCYPAKTVQNVHVNCLTSSESNTSGSYLNINTQCSYLSSTTSILYMEY